MFANAVLNTRSPGGQRVGLRWQNGGLLPSPTYVIDTNTFRNMGYWDGMLCANIDKYWALGYLDRWQTPRRQNASLSVSGNHIYFTFVDSWAGTVTWELYPLDNSPSEHGNLYVAVKTGGASDLDDTVHLYQLTFGMWRDDQKCGFYMYDSGPTGEVRVGEPDGSYLLRASSPRTGAYNELVLGNFRNGSGYEQIRCVLNGVSFTRVSTCHYDTTTGNYTFNTGYKDYAVVQSCEITPVDCGYWTGGSDWPTSVLAENIVIPKEYVTTIYQ